MITKLSQIIDQVSNRPRKKLAVAYAQDAHTLEAVSQAIDRGIADAILIGESGKIKGLCDAKGIDSSKFTIVDESNDMECVNRALKMIRAGEADILMKGLVSTDKYMRGILNKEFGLLPPKGILSHVAVLEIPSYHKLLLISDVAVIPYPEVDQKTAQLRYLIHMAGALGIKTPKIAVVAPTELMLPKIESAVHGAIFSKMGERGQLGDAVIDGPLSVDVAMDREAAEIKQVQSPVAGDADCLLFPTLDTANAFFKAVTHFSGASLAGIVTGTAAPCVLTSRGDSMESKLYSIALAALSAE